MYDEVIKLLEQREEKNSVGIVETKLMGRVVFAQAKAINQNEFFKCREGGIRPAVCLKIPFGEWNNEEIVEWNDTVYKVYRVYQGFHEIELFCEKRGGVDGE